VGKLNVEDLIQNFTSGMKKSPGNFPGPDSWVLKLTDNSVTIT
jgi:hypothetical protein